MFGSIEPTEYDLRFELLGIPVRVSPWFWAMAAILGFEATKTGVSYLIAWMGVVFVSIMVHEFGHALVARSFGYPPRVLLYQFGGLAFFEPRRDFTRFKSVTISLAGPFAGFVLYGITRVFLELFYPSIVQNLSEESARLIGVTISQMLFVNLWWGLLNLLPVIPLDGGRVSQELCLWASPRTGLQIAVTIGAVVAGVVAFGFFTIKDYYPAMLFGMLCANNVMMLQERRW
ncbi:Peptidase family M50 [Thalassoglobus neptunius]|uniref:Peptidase family M50 n=1 Tax=Thalassoglobus neptunius TaxID=1938619 RepID=A0A5C5X8H4_9PLAN|nr:site-2 protease family protein [Thalassoglobus neptunius]TWT58172.1 Peptidase family M50 [Thalassoglobus neptunius]